MIALFFLLAQPAAAEAPVDIVVQARRGKCRVQLAEALLSPDELARQASGWGGRPVRVISPDGADYKCLAKIVFKLNDKGVQLVQFEDRAPTAGAMP